MDFIVDIIRMPALWFQSICSNSKTWIIWIGAITLIMLFRYIIFPLTGTKADVFSKIQLNNKEKTGKNKE